MTPDVATCFYVSKDTFIHHIFSTKRKITNHTIQFRSKNVTFTANVNDFHGIFCISNKKDLSTALHYNLIHNIIIGLMADHFDMDIKQLHNKIWPQLREAEKNQINEVMNYYKTIADSLIDDKNDSMIKVIDVNHKPLDMEWIKVIYEYDNIQLSSLLICNHGSILNHTASNVDMIFNRSGTKKFNYINIKPQLVGQNVKEASLNYLPYEPERKEKQKFKYNNLDIMENSDNIIEGNDDVIDFGFDKEEITSIPGLLVTRKANNKIVLTVHPLKIKTDIKHNVHTQKLYAEWYFMYKLQIPLLQYLAHYSYTKKMEGIEFQITGFFTNGAVFDEKTANVVFRTPYTDVSHLYEKTDRMKIRYNQYKMANVFILPGSLNKHQYGNEVINTSTPYGNLGYYMINSASTYPEYLFDIQNAYKLFKVSGSKDRKELLIIMNQLQKFKNYGETTHFIPYNIIFGTQNTKSDTIKKQSKENTEKLKSKKNEKILDNIIYYNNIKISDATQRSDPDFNITEDALGVNNKGLVSGYNDLLRKFIAYVDALELGYDFNNKVNSNPYDIYDKVLRQMVLKNNNSSIYSYTHYMKRLLLEAYLLNNITTIKLVIRYGSHIGHKFFYSVDNTRGHSKLDLRKPNKGMDPFFNEYPFFDIETELVYNFLEDNKIVDTNDLKRRIMQRKVVDDETYLTEKLNNYFNQENLNNQEYKDLLLRLNIGYNDHDMRTLADREKYVLITDCLKITKVLIRDIKQDRDDIGLKNVTLTEKITEIDEKLKIPRKNKLNKKPKKSKIKDDMEKEIRENTKKLKEYDDVIKKLEQKKKTLEEEQKHIGDKLQQ
jgi:hypothetical protein